MNQAKLKTAHNDVNTLISDAQGMLHEAASATAARADDLRAKAMTLLEDAATRAKAVQSTAIATGKELASNTDEYVTQNPWRAVAISSAVGLLAGLAVARSCAR
jgi:ElaB/YqjD/DUF883 family membrane-anchored ribosome-binding protein